MPISIKVIIVIMLFAIIGALGTYANTKREQANFLTIEVATIRDDLKLAHNKIQLYQRAVEESRDQIEAAENERQVRVTVLSAQIAAMKKNVPPAPQSCGNSIDWAIEQKGDLSW